MPSTVSYKITARKSGYIIDLPVSKSIANRVLILNEILGQKAQVSPFSDVGDTGLMRQLLGKIKSNIGSESKDSIEIDCRDAGTVMRFLTAFLSITPGHWILTGTDRMLERPINELVIALRQLGADIDFLGSDGFPPLRIRGKELQGGELTLNSRISSQFISALMLIAPRMKKGLIINFNEEQVSRSYISMTASVLSLMGVSVKETGSTYHIGEQISMPSLRKIEADWSSAAFIYEALVLSDLHSIRIDGLMAKSIQGDSSLNCLFRKMGIETAFGDGLAILRKSHKALKEASSDLRSYPDLYPALACTSAGLGMKHDFRGIGHLRHKESDRITALTLELKKLKCLSKTRQDETSILSGIKAYNGILIMHKDHRLAMSLAPLAMVCGPLNLDDASVVEKSFPEYWKEMEKGFGLILE